MKVFITGGAGFIGCNAALRHLQRGDEVVVFDNLSRPRTELNVAWLQAQAGALRIVRGDIRDARALAEALPEDAALVYHLAGQVAVTTSVRDPRADFEANALGTFNLLEAVRARAPQAAVFYASTNKVYGGLEQVGVAEEAARYCFADLVHGVAEEQPLDFHSPYGCSKGCGDQYVRDYARIFGLKTVVFRQSCIYGTRQFGVEDQGWVAHFIIAASLGRAITIYGNGKQVRDLLWIDDLLDVYQCAFERLAACAGQVFNVGGGPDNTLSVWGEFGPCLARLTGRDVPARYLDWRPGDQPVYVSDIRKAQRVLGWNPRVAVADGLQRLFAWVSRHPDFFR